VDDGVLTDGAAGEEIVAEACVTAWILPHLGQGVPAVWTAELITFCVVTTSWPWTPPWLKTLTAIAVAKANSGDEQLIKKEPPS